MLPWDEGPVRLRIEFRKNQKGVTRSHYNKIDLVRTQLRVIYSRVHPFSHNETHHLKEVREGPGEE